MSGTDSRGRTVAYVVGQFPQLSEPYVVREIDALRARGVRVAIFAAGHPAPDGVWPEKAAYAEECTYLSTLRYRLLLRALWNCVRSAPKLRAVYSRILFQGSEGPLRRLKALVHVWVGAYLEQVMRPHAPTHIHVHHGYFPAYVGMVAGRLSGTPYSITFHGSDLLLHRVYLDLKVAAAKFVITISEYNKRILLDLVPNTDPQKVFVLHLGAEPAAPALPKRDLSRPSQPPIIVSVGRLHPVKNQAFLVQACRRLKDAKVDFLCLIIGSGPQHQRLTALIRSLGLLRQVKLLGALAPSHLPAFYRMADACVLTSSSEGIPLVLMDAMLNGAPVLAPAITGVPELVLDGRTGFLYEPDNLRDLTDRLCHLLAMREELDKVRAAAYRHVLAHFEAKRNVELVADLMVSMVQRSRAGGPAPQDR